MVAPRRATLVATALAALAAAACERPSEPGAKVPEVGGAPPVPAAPSVPAAPPSAAELDVGPIKSAAEYSAEAEFAAADLKRGELLALACAACHTFGAGQPTIVGPNLHGVFGRPAASLSEFGYSAALRGTTLTWTPKALDAWLADPSRFVAGTTMTFTGYRSAGDRRDLIAYLLRATQ